MRLNILFGGKAGQGINKVSEIVANILSNFGYFTFNYRDYESLIRGGHNFNILSISDKRVGSYENKVDGIIALDENTIKKHKNKLKKNGFIISFEEFKDLGRNLNIALAGALVKILGIDRGVLISEIKKEFNSNETVLAAEQGYNSEKERFKIGKLNNKIKVMTGSRGVSLGALNSGIDLYLAYPMTPATGVMHELASRQVENKLLVFQPESEIAVVNAALGASFTGAKTMIGSSGGGFDLFTEAFSFQGQSEIPLVVYLASRAGNSTGLPTYSGQIDLDAALRAGHGEYPRVVIAPGDPIECIEKTNEAFYLAEKFKLLSIIVSDKHLAESEFSIDRKENSVLKVEVKNKVGKEIVKKSSYEHDEKGNTVEDAESAVKNAERLLKKYGELKKEASKFEMIKIYGNKNSKNLIIGWGSTKGQILDAIEGLDVKFLQVLYMKPMSDKIREELEKAENVILVEQNSTGQLGRIIREKTGIKIENRILRYDGRPFASDELEKLIVEKLK
ncbi:hypothetical protein COV15_02460 [Candidatus Woesearchaeota archaeon CG10_big_fil_rev_8_21_14_0_10_34_12]|nr:MAG: hypothetical protein COV15_02460 [Candidatus Woesearchaeota archaeon CG10_big_fil_rev_8_21_14_0_10_34_12]